MLIVFHWLGRLFYLLLKLIYSFLLLGDRCRYLPFKNVWFWAQKKLSLILINLTTFFFQLFRRRGIGEFSKQNISIVGPCFNWELTYLTQDPLSVRPACGPLPRKQLAGISYLFWFIHTSFFANDVILLYLLNWLSKQFIPQFYQTWCTWYCWYLPTQGKQKSVNVLAIWRRC